MFAAVLAMSLAFVMIPAGEWAPAKAAAATSISSLTVEHRDNPLGIDAAKPRFGWQLSAEARGQRQTAYEILVASTPEGLTTKAADLWDSGKITSSDSVAVTYQGKPLRPSTRYFWTVIVWDMDGRRIGSAPTAFFETALMSTDGVANWDGAKWISMAGKAPNSPGAPMLRKQARLSGNRVSDARLYTSALGVYDAYINGKRVSVPQDGGKTHELLAPGWTNYDTTTNYLTYDVTDLVSGRDDVTLGAVLGNGWYNGRISDVNDTHHTKYYSSDGNALALKAKLLVRYADGSGQTVVTEPGGGWTATDTGPYREDDIYDGQSYDARKDIPAWATNGFDDSAWSGVVEHPFAAQFPDSQLVAYPGESARLMERWDRDPRSITVYDHVTDESGSANGKGHIVVDTSRSVTDPEQAKVASVTLRSGDTAIFDLGQNMVGVPRYTIAGPRGAEVDFRFGEMLNGDSEGADGPQGSVYRANLRTAKATSSYVLAGNAAGETHQDSLTYYGFRYASLSVTTPGAEVTITDFTGKVATSAIRDTGSISTNDPLVNQLFSNIRWGQRGNYLWVPTDCPQRDERQGWTGDTQVFANTGLYNGDATNFLSHFEQTLMESQRTYGVDGAQFTETAPSGAFITPVVGQSGWSDVGVVVPWTVWQMSGDRTIVDRSWAAMTKYMDWIYRRTGLTYAGQGSHFGDWLAPQATSAQLMSDAYYAYSARLMADMAKGTGRDADASKYSQLFTSIKRAFILKYLGSDPLTGRPVVRSSLGPSSVIGTLANGGVTSSTFTEDNSQTALLWVLKLGLYDTDLQRRELVDLLAENIRNDAAYRAAHPTSSRTQYAQNTLSVGFLGINVLGPVLTDQGRSGLAYTLLHQDAMPSWLYSVKNGATTIWERWNSYSTEDGFGPVQMNSFNHYSYGAIGEWMYEDMAGISKDPEHPGLKHFFLQPHLDPTDMIRHVAGSYDSPYGTITSDWTVKGETLDYQVMVPANSRATVRIPTASPASVRDGTTPLANAPGATFLGYADGVANYYLESGSYSLTSSLR